MVSQRLARHWGIQCDGPLCVGKGAHAYIVGDRYKCAVCHDTDFCANCEALPTHRHNRTHPLIKFKTPIKNVSVTTLGEKENGEHVVTLGDQLPQTSSKSTGTNAPVTKLANAATQVVGDSITKPAKPEVIDEPQAEVMVPQPELEAHLVHETVANGTVLPPSTIFSQTWTLRNPGPNKWPAGCSLHFVGGDMMYNVDLTHPSSISALESAAKSKVTCDVVEVGEEVAFEVFLKTPADQGKAVSYWRLKDGKGMPFGQRLWCNIEVGSPPEPVVVDPELQTKDIADDAVKEGVAQDDQEKSAGQMIFPTLDKESPVASIHEEESEAVVPAQASDRELLEDLKSLELESGDEEEGFLTDEEYDLLDMSDAETCVAHERK